MTQALEALEVGQRLRLARAKLFRRVRDGDLSMAVLLADPPAEIAQITLLDVVCKSSRCPRGLLALDALGAAALRDNINLLVPVERASTRQREWLASRLVRSAHGRLTIRWWSL